MHIASYLGQAVNLHTYERAAMQQLYIASIQGQVTCLHCQVPVRLKLGISQRPTFIHPPSTFDCETTVQTYAKKDQVVINTQQTSSSQGAFMIPKNRSIGGTATLEKPTTWTESETISGIAPFSEPPTQTSANEVTDPYYQKLQGINYALDDSQWRAVQTTEGPLLILAGAGSGKTRVLTSRAAYMISARDIPANRLLLVTFTTKAAKEMKERMALFPWLSKSQLQPLVIGTFHSIFYKMLMHHQPEHWQPNQLLKAGWQRDKMIKEAGREIDLDEKEFAFDQALAQIGLWKNNRTMPNEIRPQDVWEERVLHLYKRYEEIKRSNQMFDFDDMMLGCFELLQQSPSLLSKYQERFSYLLVDEFQDVNKVQYEIVKMLAAGKKNLCVVGDDDQSIYSFRGSNPAYILNYKNDYPEAKTIVLDRNYRSSHGVVAVANNMIHHNRDRNQKRLQALYQGKTNPLLFYPYDEEEEATMIVTDIKERIENGAHPNEFAVLFRTNVTARAIFERLAQSNLPFIVEQDGESFYKRKTVRKVLAFLRLAKNPEDTTAMSDLIGALFLKQSVLQDLKALSITADCTLVEALPKLETLQPFQQKKLQKVVPYFKRIATLAPLEAIEYVEKEMGLQDYLKKQGNEGNIIDKGSDDVRDLKVVAKYHASITSLIEHADHINAMNTTIKQQKRHGDEIRLMTIHRSKGLEFNHVYILGAVDGGIPHDYALDAWREGDDQPIEEERRTMYVAVTRAMESLSISIPAMRRGKKAYRSRFVREMGRRTPSPSKQK